MDIAAAVAAGRRAAEARMTDTCAITRVTGQTTDMDTGQVVDVTEPVYSGPCRVQQRSTVASRVDVGEASLLLVALELHLPVAASTDVHAEDAVQIVTSVDPDLVGKHFTVKQVAHKTDATARRLGIQEVTS